MKLASIEGNSKKAHFVFTSKNEFNTSFDTFNASNAVNTKYIMLIILCLGDNFFSAMF